MAEFAAAAMVRVLAQGMRDLGLDPGPAQTDAHQAHVSLLTKRQLVQSAVQQGGIGCLPLLGRGLHQLSFDPTHDALCGAASADELFVRWQRLERYIHSNHRCEVLAHGTDHAELRHVALPQIAPPLPAEDLVVLGVLAALLEAIGLQAVRVHIAAVPVYPAPDLDGLRRAIELGATAHWRFSWSGTVKHQSERSWPAELGADDAWPAITRRVYLRLLADLTAPPTVVDLAAELGTPSRSLQRELSRAGMSYSRLLSEARCRASAWRLLHTELPVAEIGFLSGYADQAHFTRELRRRVGLTPAGYRRSFALTAA